MSLEATRVSRVTGIVFFLPPLNRIAVCALAECSHSFIHEVAFGPSFREPLGGVGRGWLVGALGGLCRSVGLSVVRFRSFFLSLGSNFVLSLMGSAAME